MKLRRETQATNPTENPYTSPTIFVRGGKVEAAIAFEKLQPIKKIWFHPCLTVQTLFKFNTSYGSLVLTSMVLAGWILSQQKNFLAKQGVPVGSVIILAGLGGTVLGIGLLIVFALFLKWTGKAMSGHWSMKQLRTAMPWGCFPMSLCVLLSVSNLALGGKLAFVRGVF